MASHSALDVLDGAKEEKFRTVAVAKKGREKPYQMFPVVDELILVDEFVDMVSEHVLRRLGDSVFVPNRSFSVYVGYNRIEKNFPIPVFGNRFLLRWEERTGEANYYRLLDAANIRRPETYRLGEPAGPVLVKLPESKRPVEREFFVAASAKDAEQKLRTLLQKDYVDEHSLEKISVEEFVLGAHFNANFFYTVMRKRLELHSIDRRIQSNLDGVYRLPAADQLEINPHVKYIEVGHEPATIRESLLEKVFEIGEKFVEACRRIVPPGILGPFTLQFIVTPELDLVVYDVSTRIGGGTNVYMGYGGQYSKLYFGKPISMGKRIAMEIREALETGSLDEVTT